MATLYKARPGTVVKSSLSSPAFMSVTGLSLRDAQMIATSFKLDRGQDVQHQKTLSQDIYTYAFGESIGRASVGGMLFFGDCSGVSAESVSTINDFYSENNLYTKGSSVTVTIGSGNSFKCYLENLSIVAEASSFNIGGFNLGFSVMPSKF